MDLEGHESIKFPSTHAITAPSWLVNIVIA